MKKEKIWSICAVSIMIDQFIKVIISLNMKLDTKLTVIPNFFSIYYLHNDGAAFSSFSGMRYILILISLIIFFVFARHIKNNKIEKKVEIVALGFILGGLVGNLIDRILYGYVIDYLSFKIFNYSFAVFNFADSLIVIGTFLLIIDIIKNDFKKKGCEPFL